ncbi:hypothetical protein F0562_034473 [Nyssa sinensis]|uniref:Uncharacterized protein n=1 Tax=Nyssa sinensis TaxID=561372 RepID=A0A5J5AFZ8_9ASTE|nr:hypothetical protein F0562_034473 [Nyssa sinensis]
MAAATGVMVIVAYYSGVDRGLDVSEIGIVLRFCVMAQDRVKRYRKHSNWLRTEEDQGLGLRCGIGRHFCPGYILRSGC